MAMNRSDSGSRPLTPDRRPLYVRAAEAIRGLIAESYPAGTELPGEEELSATFGIGRSSVREALVQLEADGLIIRQRGTSTRVTALAHAIRVGIESLEPVEVLAERQGLVCRTDALEITEGKATPAEAASLGRETQSQVIRVLRTKVTSDGPLAVMESTIPTDSYDPNLIRSDLKDSLTALLAERGMIQFAESEVLLATANKITAPRLRIAEGEPVLLLTERCFGETDRPTALTHIYFVPGRVRLELIRRVPPHTW